MPHTLDPGDGVEAGGLVVRPGLVIPASELAVRHSRSGGPGGQNVNKVSTRVELEFDVAASGVLTAEEKERLRVRLRRRISQRGVLRLVAQRWRSQARNEADARQRLAALLAAALAVSKTRRATRVPSAVRVRRLEAKRQRSAVKRARRTPGAGD